MQKDSLTVSNDASKLANIPAIKRNDEETVCIFSSKLVQLRPIDCKQARGMDLLCHPSTYSSKRLSLCLHEEADTHNSIMIREVDTDLVVLAVVAVHTLELWESFGTGKNHKMVPTRRYVSALVSERSRRLPIFHALTGSDTTSFFARHGKKVACDYCVCRAGEWSLFSHRRDFNWPHRVVHCADVWQNQHIRRGLATGRLILVFLFMLHCTI